MKLYHFEKKDTTYGEQHLLVVAGNRQEAQESVRDELARWSFVSLDDHWLDDYDVTEYYPGHVFRMPDVWAE